MAEHIENMVTKYGGKHSQTETPVSSDQIAQKAQPSENVTELQPNKIQANTLVQTYENTSNHQPLLKKLGTNDDDCSQYDLERELFQYLNEEAEKNSQLVLKSFQKFNANTQQKILNAMTKKYLKSKLTSTTKKMNWNKMSWP